MNNILTENNDEINFYELLSIIWVHKLIVLFFVVISIFFSGIYALNTDKTYTASAIFKLRSIDDKRNSPFTEDLGALAGLMGDMPSASSETLILERINGRIFIEALDKDLDFKSDRFYNSYDPKAIDPLWKATIKKLLNYSNDDLDKQEIAWRSILVKYRKSTRIELTDAGSLVVEVNHANPERASEVANKIMNTIINDQDKKFELGQSEKLSYLSSSLAESLFDLEKSQSKLKDFALENTTMPIEGFSAASLGLEIAKETFLETQELFFAVEDIVKIYKQNKKNQLSYINLKKDHPIIDDVKFRRIFGQNEIVSDWSWPSLEMVNIVFKTLYDRMARLEIEVANAEENANQLAETVATFTQLQRENSIAEASYTVMLEQVKANSMLTGFSSTNTKSEIYQYAATPISPSSPNRNLILIMGALLGGILGMIIALIVNKWRDVFYSNVSLLTAHKISYFLRTRTLRKLSNKTFSQINIKYKSASFAILRDLKLEIKHSNKKVVLISGIGSKLRAKKLSRLLAFSLQSEGSKVAYIDFSRIVKNQDLDNDLKTYSNKNFNIIEKYENLTILTPSIYHNSIDFITKNKSKNILQNLISDFDTLILSADGNNTLSIARFCSDIDTYHIALTSKNKTKRRFLHDIYRILPFEANFYD